MKILKRFYLLIPVLLVFAQLGCASVVRVESSGPSLSNASTPIESPAQIHEASTPTQEGIRNVDFSNFTYNWFPDYAGVKLGNHIKLRNGKNEPVEIKGSPLPLDRYQEQLENISYVDLDGDDLEEAVVVVEVAFYKYTPRCIFVFSNERGKPVEKWRYETGGRQRDFRGLKLDGRKLVMEEYDEQFGDPPTCCPKRYFRTVFAWENNSLKKVSEEIVNYELKYREYLGYPSARWEFQNPL